MGSTGPFFKEEAVVVTLFFDALPDVPAPTTPESGVAAAAGLAGAAAGLVAVAAGLVAVAAGLVAVAAGLAGAATPSTWVADSSATGSGVVAASKPSLLVTRVLDITIIKFVNIKLQLILLSYFY